MEDCNEVVDCTGRREFLIKTAMLAGGLVLTLSGATALTAAVADVVVPINDKSPLNKVGGSLLIPSDAGKIIIVRTGETTFVAFSAKCTHKGGTVEYEGAKKQFYCAKHGSTFDSSDGKAINGPADEPLPQYPAKGTSTSVTVTVGP